MNNKIDDVLELTREISLQDSEEDIDFSVTEFGDQLSSTNDIEFLWRPDKPICPEKAPNFIRQ